MTGFFRRPSTVAAVAAVLALVGAGTGHASVAGDGVGHIAAWPGSAAPTAGGGFLNAVVALSPSSAWAAGDRIIRWNGARWSAVSGALPGLDLTGLDTVSATDAWAVGSQCPTSSCATDRTLVMHWNGAKWSRVPSPNPGGATWAVLNGISMVSATDGWAAGEFCKTGTGCPSSFQPIPRTLLMHWNGSRWSIVSSKGAEFDGLFAGVSAVSAGDAWAVGYRCAAGCAGGSPTIHTLIVHWNGRAWSHVSSPAPAGDSSLASVDASSTSDAWAVGSGPGTLALRWNGHKWTTVKSPSPRAPGGFSFLSGMTVLPNGSAWAVGGACTGCATTSSHYRTLILRWNGSRWSIVKSPDPNPGWDYLEGVSAVSSKDAWAVGTDCATGCPASQMLIMRWNGTSWSAG